MSLAQRKKSGRYYTGKSEEVLKTQPFRKLRSKVNLIFTSPPFPLNSKKSYGNMIGNEYRDWFASLAPLFAEMLTDDGSIVIELGNSWESSRPVQSLLPLQCLLDFVSKEDTGLRLIQEFISYNPSRLPSPAAWVTDREVISSMVEYYKDNIKTGDTSRSQLDTFTRYEFSFSGLECSILGSFYKDDRGITCFGADLENFYSAHNYSVIKPSSDILKAIVNYREDNTPGGTGDIKIGKVRYSSSRRFQQTEEDVPV